MTPAKRLQQLLSLVGLVVLLASSCARGSPDSASGRRTTERQARWVLVGQGDSGTRLDLRFEEGNSCASLERTDIRETADRVVIAVIVKQREPSEGEACQDLLRIADTAVRLKDPLGKRTLIGECTDPDCERLKGG